jgi:hypothetical protein
VIGLHIKDLVVLCSVCIQIQHVWKSVSKRLTAISSIEAKKHIKGRFSDGLGGETR